MLTLDKYQFETSLEAPVTVGVVVAPKISPKSSDKLEDRLTHWKKVRSDDLDEKEDAFRRTVRDMLRNGSYKPTGRGKPASEYLIKTARKGSFPRINPVVDINNYISLKYLTPISLWDLDKAPGTNYRFQLGNKGDSFIFNEGGQRIDVTDLVCGYVEGGDGWQPIINPVKDSQLTKTDDETGNIGVAIYYPTEANHYGLPKLLEEFTELLQPMCDGKVESGIL